MYRYDGAACLWRRLPRPGARLHAHKLLRVGIAFLPEHPRGDLWFDRLEGKAPDYEDIILLRPGNVVHV